MGVGGNIIGRMGAARESAYFKIEQEAELQRHRRRLVREGHIQEIAGARLGGAVGHAATDSSANFEVLAEILQQRARVYDPHAAARKDFVRRIKGMPARLSAAEVARYRSSMAGAAALVGHVPRLALGGRNRYGLAAAAAQSVATAPPPAISPEAAEVARRSYNAGVRALAYGSVLGFLGVAAGTTLAVRAMDVRSAEEFRDAVRSAAEPAAAALRSRAAGFKASIQGFLGLDPEADGSPAADGDLQQQRRRQRQPEGELQKRLASRWNPRVAGSTSL